VLKGIACAAIAALVIVEHRAAAGGMDTDAVACGSAPASWSAPRGAIVGVRLDDAVAGVIDTVGEYRTHAMLSHGIGAGASQAIAHAPGRTGWPTYCSRPLRARELEHGYPGASRVNEGGAYANIYVPSLEHVGYTIPSDDDRRDLAERTAGVAQYDLPAMWLRSIQDPAQGLELLSETGWDHSCDRNWFSHGSYYLSCPAAWRGTGDGCDCGCQWTDPDCGAGDFRRLEYSSFQYRNLENRHLANPSVTNNGVQCSSFIALLFHKETGDHVEPFTYDHATSVAAAEGLYDRVLEQCDAGLGFWGSIGAAITCFELICDDAARQVRNCFIDPAYCDSDSDVPWQRVRTDAAAVSTTISPDRLLGQSGHPGQWAPHVGPWAGDAEVPLTWSSGGNVYGCWF